MRQLALVAMVLAACSTNRTVSGDGGAPDSGMTRDAGTEPHDAGHIDAGAPTGCTTDLDCGATSCASATCGTCERCDTDTCSTMQLGACSYDGGASQGDITLLDASTPPHLKGELIDICCAFDGGTELNSGFAFSDGGRAVASANDPLFNQQVFLGPTGDPGTLTRATPSTAWGIAPGSFPAFSPDNTRLAGRLYTTTDSAGNSYASLWLANADGSGSEFIDTYVDELYLGANCLLYDSTKDGLSNQDGRSLHVASWTATTAGAELESYDEEPSPGFSPDGSHIAWLAQDGTLKSLACDDLSNVHTFSTGCANLVGSPNGQQMLYVALPLVDAGFVEGTVMLSAWDGSNAQTLGTVDQGDNLAWSPDGTAFIYQTGSGDAHLLHVHQVASGAEWISPAEGEIEQAAFTADSAYVTYAIGDPNNDDQYGAIFGVAVGAPAGSAPAQYGTGTPLAWTATGAGGGWVAVIFAGADPMTSEQSTLVVWPMSGGSGTTITTYAGPQTVSFSLDAEYLVFGAWGYDPSLGGAELAAIVGRTASGWNTTHLVALSQEFGLEDGFTAGWAANDWLLVQGTTFGPGESLYVLKADGSDYGLLAAPASPQWYVAPGGATAYYATSAGIWRVTF